MPNTVEYLASLPSKNHPSFRPPCCPLLERNYVKLFTEFSSSFNPSTKVFKKDIWPLGQFTQINLKGGEDWEDIGKLSGLHTALIKNPYGIHTELIGEKNGLVIINNKLIAIAPVYPSMYAIRRPFRTSHLLPNSPDIQRLFQEFANT